MEQRHQSDKGKLRHKSDNVVLREIHLCVQPNDEGIHRARNQEYVDDETDYVTQVIPYYYSVPGAFDRGQILS